MNRSIRMVSILSIFVLGAAKHLPQEQSEGRCDQWSFFPPRTFITDKKVHDFMSWWFSADLAAAKEFSLCMLNNENLEIYRFLWVRAFDPPVVIRAESTGQGYRVVVKELDRQAIYQPKPATLVVDRELSISESDWNNIIYRLEKASFWEMPTEGGEAGMDGAEWVLEGLMGGHYHVVRRWSPDSGNFWEACLFMLELSGLNISPDRVY